MVVKNSKKVNALVNKPRKERPPDSQRNIEKYPRTRGDDWEEFGGFGDKVEWDEFVRCSQSVEYFISQYCCVVHPEDGLVPCGLYGFQRCKVLPAFLNERFVITRKFRQGGFSTVAALVILWMLLFDTDLKILVISKGDREAVEFMSLIKTAYDYLPEFLRCVLSKNNEHIMETDHGCKVSCYTPKAGVSFSCKLIVIDEAAHIEQDMKKIWGKIYPVISAGGNCWVISTSNGVVGHGEWYYKQWIGAASNTNFFFPLDVEYTEHPDYQSKEWEEQTKANIGDFEWRQQFLREFLGEANSIFNENILSNLLEWAEEPSEVMPCLLLPEGSPQKNLQFWERNNLDPNEEFMVVVDPCEGNGANEPNGLKNDKYDYATIQVLSMRDLRQCAEYQNDAIKPQDLAKVAMALGMHYNNATVVCEAGPLGQVFLSHLIDILGYDAFYCSDPSKKPGLIVSGANRPIITSGAVNIIEKRLVRIKSKRAIHELRTLVWNQKKQRIDHMEQYHDDLFTSLAYGYYVREELLRQLPPGMGQEYKPIYEFTQIDMDRLISRVAVGEVSGDSESGNSGNDLVLPSRGGDVETVVYTKPEKDVEPQQNYEKNISWSSLDSWGN